MGSSTEPDRSLSSGISIPQWMKNKIGDRYDIEETFSPPMHDDSFFYIRYPKSTKSVSPEPVKPEQKPIPVVVQDFSQHTLPCRQFITTSAMNSETKQGQFLKPQASVLKSQGSENDLSGDEGACGKSVVDVAKQMISGKSVIRGFSVAGSNDNLAVPGFDPKHRRGSKSLPASPLGSPSQSPESSPRLHRRVAHPNRYFTGTFVIPDKDKTSEDSNSRFGSWIWSGFLGRENVPGEFGTPLIIEEEQHEKQKLTLDTQDGGNKHTRGVDRHVPLSSFISVDETVSDNSIPVSKLLSDNKKQFKLQPKPSELREMNFWSPTSM